MNLQGTRRVMETESQDTANQYLRFGWNLINQYVVEATPERAAGVKYVLASIRRLEDTRQLVEVTTTAAVNQYLDLGWRLIDKWVSANDTGDVRQETPHFVLAWQNEETPPAPGMSGTGATHETRDLESVADSLDIEIEMDR